MIIYAVEGIIAAGKTELVQALSVQFNILGYSVCHIYEPVDIWQASGILQKFYDDPIRYAYSFQTFAFATRCLEICKQFEEHPSADIYILERSPISDKIFMELQDVDECEREMYKLWCSAYERILPFDISEMKIIYLQTGLATCMQRLYSRGRSEETNVSSDYQWKLKNKHDKLLAELSNCIISIPPELANLDFRDNKDNINKIFQLVIS